MRSALIVVVVLTLPMSVAVSQPPVMTAEQPGRVQPEALSTPRYVAGGLVGSFYGFGIGHAIQGRWLEGGWKYTAGDALAGTAVLFGLGGMHCEKYCELYVASF